jgi:hypothetical protein
MTDKPIIQIQLDTDAFDKFRANYAEYQSQLKTTGPQWTAHADSADDIRQHVAKIHDLLSQQGELLADALGHERNLATEFETVGVSWMRTGKLAQMFSQHVHGTTINLLKWSGLTAAFSGLLAAGGLYGIDRMAAGVAERRRSALGSGTTYGEAASFDVNFGRLGNAQGVLHGFNVAQHSAKSTALATLGLKDSLAGKTPAQAFAEALPEIRRKLQSVPQRMRGRYVADSGLAELGIGLPEANVIASMSDEELAQIRGDAFRDSKTLALSEDAQRSWTEFSTQLRKAEVQIETILARNLAPLSGPLDHLSKAVVALVEASAKPGGIAEKAITTLGRELDDFASLVGGPASRGTISEFLSVGQLAAKEIETVAHWFGAHYTAITHLGKAVLAYRVGGVAGLAAYEAGTALNATTAKISRPEDLYSPGNGQPTRAQKENAQRPTREEISKRPGSVDLGNGAWSVKDDKGRHVEFEKNEAISGGGYSHLPRLAKADVADVDPRLLEIVEAGAGHLPPGYHARINEGYNPGGHVGNSQHHIRGKGAIDVSILDKNGNPLPNEGGDPTGLYHRMARGAYGEMLRRHPELKGKLAWGGAFGASRSNPKPDLMHFDIGGSRGAIAENRLENMGPLDEDMRAPAARRREKYAGSSANLNLRHKFGHPRHVEVDDQTGGQVRVDH